MVARVYCPIRIGHAGLALELVSVMHDVNIEFEIRMVCCCWHQFVGPLFACRDLFVQNSPQSIVHCVGNTIGMDCLNRMQSMLVARPAVAVARQSNIVIGQILDRFVKFAAHFDSAMAVAVIAADAAAGAAVD